jgi:RHS repeat-associated protein
VLRVTSSGAQARWQYDTAGRPAALVTAGQEFRFGYDPAGRERWRELPGGLRLAHDWDTAGRLTAQTLVTAESAGGSGGRLLQRRAYSYRADGCLTGLEDLLSGPRRLTLDAGGRVTAVAGPDWSEQYGYDQAGNVTTAAWPAPPRPADDWMGADAQGTRHYSGTLITGAGGVRYQHDAQGRITMRQRVRLSRKPDTWRYEWDADNRLTSVTTPDGTRWRYLYDPLGRRTAKQRLGPDGGVAAQTDFTWDGPVLAEEAMAGSDPAHRRIRTWDYRPGTFTPLAQAEHTTSRYAGQERVDQAFYAIVTDLIGSASELVSLDGTLAGYQQHTLWGGTLWHPQGASSPLRFPGQYADPETGLHYNHHRFYDPATGRYLSPDPLGLAPAPNPHAYVFNPQVAADPLGLMQCGGPISFLDRSDPVNEGIYQKFLRSERAPGYQDILIHGAENAPGFEVSGKFVSPSGLADALRANPAYAGGPIRLLACRAGYEWGGAAQQLSDELGVPVMAPTDDLWIHRDGSMTIGPTGKDDTGIWFNFYPGAPNRPNLAHMIIPGTG